MARFAHKLPFGAELQPDGTTRFRLWAPSMPSVALEVAGDARPMQRSTGRLVRGRAPRAGRSTRYMFVLPDGMRVPDPASRAQVGRRARSQPDRRSARLSIGATPAGAAGRGTRR